jgi:hypothetical protein
MIVSSELNPRQEKLSAFYKARKVPLFGASEYTLLVPAPDSILLTDENVTVAFILFGDTFDRKLRSIVIAIWLPALIFQLACSPIGFLTLTGMLPTKIVILTFPGAIFPFLLLLRSHWIVIHALFKKWEPLFLTFYSIIWCLSITFIVGKLDLRCIFVWLVIFPSLMASTFADASAVRLDFAFLKGDLSIAALTMPPYLISLAYVFTFIVVLNTRVHVEVEDQNKSLLVQSSGLSFDIQYSYIGTITGFTICLFIVKSIIMLFYHSSRCISLNAAMCIDVVRLSKTLTPVELSGRKNRKESSKTKFGKSKKMSSDKNSFKDGEKDGNDDILILEAGFLLKGRTGLVPVIHGKSKTNALFRMISRQISSQNSLEGIQEEEIITPPVKTRKFSMEDIRIVPQLSTRDTSDIISSRIKLINKVTPCMEIEVPADNQHQSHIVLHQLTIKKMPSLTLDKSSIQDAADVDTKKQSLSRDELELTNTTIEVSRFAKISNRLAFLRPLKIRPNESAERQEDKSVNILRCDNDLAANERQEDKSVDNLRCDNDLAANESNDSGDLLSGNFGGIFIHM